MSEQENAQELKSKALVFNGDLFSKWRGLHSRQVIHNTAKWYHLNIFGEIVVIWWFRYGGGIAPPPTQPPIIEMIRQMFNMSSSK
jgi:hypothetical protein